MNANNALFSIAGMIFIYLFGSRYEASYKDFVYLNPNKVLRRLLYVREIPTGKITLSSFAIQYLILLTIIIQLFSILGANILKPILSVVWFERIVFLYPDNPYFQTIFCVGIYFPVCIIIIIYILVCGIFAPERSHK